MIKQAIIPLAGLGTRLFPFTSVFAKELLPRYGDNAPMAIIEFVDRDVEAKRIDKPKKDANKEASKAEEKKQATA